MKTVDDLIEQLDLTIEEIASRAKMPLERVSAIAIGRWTPSPAERARLAAVLGVSVEEISWGHTMPPRNVRYHQFGFEEGL